MKKIVIWDEERECSISDARVILWRGCARSVSNDFVSLPIFVENNSELIRKKYLDWVHDLQNLKFRGKYLPDFFHECLGLDYWALLPIVEKCNFFKSPQINDALGLLALDVYASDIEFDVVAVASSNPSLINSIRHWAGMRSKKFSIIPLKSPKKFRKIFFEMFLSVTPNPLRASIWLVRYIFLRWPLRNVGIENWKNSKASIIFFSYMFGFKLDKDVPEAFINPYWKSLPKMLNDIGLNTRWLHIFVEDSLIPSAKEARNTINVLNASGEKLQSHVVLDSFLCLMVIFKSLKKWLILLAVSSKILRAIDAQDGLNRTLWSLFRSEWKNSITGEFAIKALITYFLIEESLKNINTQQKGVFLQENQGWERGLIFAWKKYMSGYLIGFPHTVIRFWDLRYFLSQKAYSNESGYKLPMPNKIAISGPVAKNEFLLGGYPSEDLVDVEALRYMHLFGKFPKERRALKFQNTFRMLVLGDYDTHIYFKQINILREVISCLTGIDLRITVKPHPKNAKSSPSKFDNFQYKSEPIEILLAECDFVYVGAVTSAAVDARLCGLPVISLRTGEMVNLSPLRGIADVMFISNPNELMEAIRELTGFEKTLPEDPQFFNLNPELSLWMSLLRE